MKATSGSEEKATISEENYKNEVKWTRLILSANYMCWIANSGVASFF